MLTRMACVIEIARVFHHIRLAGKKIPSQFANGIGKVLFARRTGKTTTSGVFRLTCSPEAT